jgi:aquaporin Z
VLSEADTRPTVRARLIGEAVGTFALVLAGTGAIVADDAVGGVTHVGVALTFGLVVAAMIYAFGDVSGAHINPAVTLAFFAARRFEGRLVVPYVLAQLGGALAGSATVSLLFPPHPTLGATLPSGAVWPSFVLEVVLTFLLMLVILRVSSGARETGIMAGVAIGGFVALAALFAGPISGASMNPARSLGPAVLSGQLAALPIYLIAPAIGALLAIPVCRRIGPSACCPLPGACA